MQKRMLQFFTCGAVFLLASLLFVPQVQGTREVSIVLDGNPVVSDVSPYIDENSRTLVPVRFVAEALGGDVSWDGKNRRVEITRSTSVVELFIGQKTALVDAAEVEMDTTAVIENERTMVPLRFVAESFTVEVGWCGETRTVSLSSEILKADSETEALPAVISASQLNVRTGPAVEYPRLAQLSQGTEVTLTGQTGDWWRILFNREGGEAAGWVDGRYVKEKASPPVEPEEDKKDPVEEPEEKGEKEEKQPSEPPPPEPEQLPQASTPPAPPVDGGSFALSSASKSVMVMKDMVNVRSSPGTSFPIIDRVYFGERLEVASAKDGWYQVHLASGQQGWLAGWLVATYYENPREKGSFVSAQNFSGPVIASWSGKKAPDSSAAKGLPVITGLEVILSEEGAGLRVKGDGGLEVPNIFKLKTPSRMVFDFKGRLGDVDEMPPLEVHQGSVIRIRASQYTDDTVRIVTDLQDGNVRAVTRKRGGDLLEFSFQSVFPPPNTVIIDPGHATISTWGSDTGAVGRSGLTEREVNTNISRMLGEILLEEGFSVLYTREGETSLALQERALAANQSGGIFVSMHANAHPDSAVSGTETFYPGERGGASDELLAASKRLADHVQSELLSQLQRKDRGVKRANFAVLRNNQVPSILVEVAFLSNSQEEKLLADPSFQKRAAQAVARGIKNYAEEQQDRQRIIAAP